MKRTVLYSAACLLATSCIFGDSETLTPADMTSDVGASDMARDLGTVEDLGQPDLQPPVDMHVADMAPDLSTPDMATPDMAQPDMAPPVRDPSAVCEMGASSDSTGAHQYRLRVNSSGSFVSAGFVVPAEGADILGHTWAQWETSELWVDMDFSGSPALLTEAIVADPTGIASVPWGGVPGAIITRRNAQNCVYAEWSQGVAGSLDCANSWGAEIANLGGPTPVYFWFGEDGTISSMRVDDLSPLGQRITVPWCAQDPANPTECLPLEYGTTDARANRGPNVLLSDALGRAYLWDAVQNIDGSPNAVDCVTPPTPPVPLLIQGMPVMFANADVVRVGAQDFLVHQTAASVSLHPLDANLQPMAATEQLANNGLKPHFDAASDGTRVAAAGASGSEARVFAFGTTGGTRDIVLDGSDVFLATAVGIAIKDDQVAVAAGRAGFFKVAVNGFTMWQ